MKTSMKLLASVVFFATLLAASFPVQAGITSPPASDLVRVTVTATGRDNNPPPEVARDEVLVYQDGQRRPVVDWVPAQGEQAGLDLAILIEDSLDSSVGLQLNDLSRFIQALPPTVRVGVAYAHNGVATFRQDFTADHALAAKALRLPLGTVGAFASPSLSLLDLFQRWPDTSNRHAVLLISDGIDLFRGGFDSPGSNVDLQRAIDHAQRNGIPVFTLYATGAGRARRNFFLVMNGQGNLSRLAYETGGEAFFQGFQTPLAYEPFLQDLTKLLAQQYVLTFRAQLGEKAGYRHLRVTTERPGVELMAPTRVYVPAAK